MQNSLAAALPSHKLVIRVTDVAGKDIVYLTLVDLIQNIYIYHSLKPVDIKGGTRGSPS